MLGPFAAALRWVLNAAEDFREDGLDKGMDLHGLKGEKNHPLGYMSGSMLVFRGALLPANTVA